MKTMLLDTVGWDVVLDAYGNIAVATEPYQLAQDAASAIRLFLGELWYDTTQGVPYWSLILGKSPPPLALMKSQFEGAAKTVPGVVAAKAFIASVADRRVTGQIQVTDVEGRITAADF